MSGLVGVLIAVTAFAAGIADGASTANVVVSADVLTATTLNVNGCAPNTPGTNFGPLSVGAIDTTDADCVVQFGASNDGSSLRLAQSDGIAPAMAQPTNTWTRNGGTTSRIFNVDGISNVIWATAANGTSFRSTTTGASWSTKDVNGAGAANLGSVSTPTTSAAWLAGGGEVWRTTQSDQACAVAATACWSNVTVNGAQAVMANTADEAWTVGNWSISPTGAADPGNVYLDSNIYYTANGGGLWTAQATPLTGDFGAIRGFDSNTLVAWRTSGTGIIATHDGSTWRNLNAPNFVNDVWAFDDNTMVAITNSGLTYRTTNAMNALPTWTTISSGQTQSLIRIRCSVTICIAVGERGAQVTSTDEGLTWTAGDADTMHSLGAMAKIGASTYVAGSPGDNLFMTTNDGADWTQVRATAYDQWNDVAAIPGTRFAWRVGTDGSIDHSADGGFSWSNQVAANVSSDELLAVHAFDSLRVIVVGRNGTIRRTTDGGGSWATVTSPTTVQLNALDGTPSGIAWAAGSNGVVVGTRDFGATWSVQYTLTGRDFRSVMAFDDKTAMVTGFLHGTAGVAARTTDGTTWSAFTPPNSASSVLSASSAPGTNIGTMLVNGGLYRSMDAGATWTVVAAPGTHNNAKTITMADSNTVFVGGLNTLRQSLDGGSTYSALSLNFHVIYGIAAFDRTSFVTVGDGGTHGTTGSTGSVPDYVLNSTDFYDHGTEAFGACLRSTTGTPTWIPNVTCDQSVDGTHWRGIPTTLDVTSEVARTTSGDGIRNANLRFGIRVSATEPAGELSAGLTFLLVAPGVP